MKKVILVVLIIIFLGAGGFFVYRKISKKEEAREAPKVVSRKRPEVNLLDLEKRPYVTIVPRADGRELFVTIDQLKMDEKRVEYELEYQAGTLLQGAGGRIDFSEEPAPVTKKILLGSCSKGKCKYDEDVSGGSLSLYFEGKEDYGLKGEWSLGLMSEREGVFTSRDVKISLDVGENGLASSAFVIVFNTLGLPEEVGDEVLAGPVGFFTSGAEIKKGTLAFRGVKEEEGLKVLGWDGSDWQEYEVKREGDDLAAEVDQLGTFVLAKE